MAKNSEERTFKNKNIVQSYLQSTAKYEFTQVEKRIVTRIIELAQFCLEGQKLDANFDGYNAVIDRFENLKVEIPYSKIVDPDEKNHKTVRDALRRLNKKTIEYWEGKTWKLRNFISEVDEDIGASIVRFRVSEVYWRSLLDFSKGYRRYELNMMFKLDSIYSMRFYEMVSEQKQPITYSIDFLKEMFNIEGKYSRITDFIKRVVEPAKAELDEKSPYSFTYKLVKNGRRYSAIKLKPIHIPSNQDPELERSVLQNQVSLRFSLSKPVIDYLTLKFEFDTQGIKNNLDKLVDGENNIPDFLSWMAEKKQIMDGLRGSKKEVRNPPAYLLTTIDNELKQPKNAD